MSNATEPPLHYKVTGWIDTAAPVETLIFFLKRKGFQLEAETSDSCTHIHKTLGALNITLAEPYLLDGEIGSSKAEPFFQVWFTDLSKEKDFGAQLDFFEEDGRLVSRRTYP